AAAELALSLRQNGIIVRHFKQSRIQQFLRITIGTEKQNERLVNTLTTLLGG
ncbi:MAG: histidinol-phosphate aminotransferase, partial [Flavobacteriaceae bacterium]